MTEDLVDVSEQFLRAFRYEDPTEEYEETLATYDSEDLVARLDTDEKRLAFWCNLYNAATQKLLETNREAYEKRRTFFSRPAITVAGEELSLDDIEHGILRRSYSKLALGYIRTPGMFRDSFAEQHEVSERDPRVHFALNCGAESCPPIVAYTSEDIDDQLDLAARSYLEETVFYDPTANEAVVPQVIRWYRGDFRVSGGIVAFLREYDQLPEDLDPDITFNKWDWSLNPGKFADRDELETAPAQRGGDRGR